MRMKEQNNRNKKKNNQLKPTHHPRGVLLALGMMFWAQACSMALVRSWPWYDGLPMLRALVPSCLSEALVCFLGWGGSFFNFGLDCLSWLGQGCLMLSRVEYVIQGSGCYQRLSFVICICPTRHVRHSFAHSFCKLFLAPDLCARLQVLDLYGATGGWDHLLLFTAGKNPSGELVHVDCTSTRMHKQPSKGCTSYKFKKLEVK